MSDLPGSPDSNRNVPEDRDDVGTPRWVRAFGIVAAVLILLFLVLHLAGGGFRGHASQG